MYTPPVNVLLTIGDLNSIWLTSGDWLDYPTKYGLTTADVPELIRLLLDKSYDMAVSSVADVWGKAHACRALVHDGGINPVVLFVILLRSVA